MYEFSDETINTYEQAKKNIRSNKKAPAKKRPSRYSLEEFNESYPYKQEKRGIDIADITQIGTKVVIGGGLGLLAGVGAIAVAASAGEIVIAGVVTKITGIVGGALGFSMGMNQAKKSPKRYVEQV
ncbi:MAG: hypothetical protein HQK75_14190 [Candidatus Magnetomorum sp.]|nr:hypothetical protein [Candidatus Magnetomorum sp.]